MVLFLKVHKVENFLQMLDDPPIHFEVAVDLGSVVTTFPCPKSDAFVVIGSFLTLRTGEGIF